MERYNIEENNPILSTTLGNKVIFKTLLRTNYKAVLRHSRNKAEKETYFIGKKMFGKWQGKISHVPVFAMLFTSASPEQERKT